MRPAAWLGLGLIAATLGCGSSDEGLDAEHSPDPCQPFVGGVQLPNRSVAVGARAGRSCAFLGIPYATAPAGDLRWRAPVARAIGGGSYHARDFGPRCPQLDSAERVIGSEDCLTLNVWTSFTESASDGDDEPKPVLVFLHGGGNVSGRSSEPEYDGRELSARGRLVVVTLNFRLGAFGYLAHPELGMEHPSGASGNFGLLDQIAGLEWVHENVTAFGGDPARVLVVGQSAGARNACALIASERARGLFSAAALHSGACNVRPLAEQERIGDELARAAGCATPGAPACLRALGVERIIRALPGVPGPLVASEHNPNVDGWLVERPPLETMARGAHNRVPIIVSTNRDEVSGAIAPAVSAEQYSVLVRTLFGEALTPELLARYPAGSNPRDDLVRMITDARYACPARRTARAATAGGSRVFRAVFAQPLSRGPEAELEAYHGLELRFLFRSFERVGYHPTERELALSDRMILRYAAFAAAGDPNGGPGEPWPLYVPDADRHIRFEDPVTIGDEVSAHCDFWDALLTATDSG